MDQNYIDRLNELRARFHTQQRVESSQRIARIVVAVQRDDLDAAKAEWLKLPLHVRELVGPLPASAGNEAAQ